MSHRILLLLGICLATLPLAAQNCGSRDTVSVQPLGTTDYVLTIDDLVNNNLADPAQGVCGVEIDFAHQYVYDLVITLFSPAGDSVILIGPDNNQSRPTTIFARWFIDFTQCGAPTAPDAGAPAVWNNNHPFNWSVGGIYTGTYQPNQHCLEDFDSGPANGNWRLQVQSNRPGAQGAVTFFRLIFCDERGIDCCFANAGAIDDGSLTRCVGHPDLELELPASYNQPRPDTNEYAYTYLVAEDGAYFGIDSTLDLTTYAPGDYQLCGFSYRRGDLANLPAPDGVYTLEDLRADLASLTPSLCGDLSPACFDVLILPEVDTTFLAETICTGDSYSVGNNTYSATGNYLDVLVGRGLCDSVVALDLTVVDQLEFFIDTSLCFGTGINVGSSFYDQPGSYTDTLTSSFGCDSIVYSDIAIRGENLATLQISLCIGDTLFIGGEAFFSNTQTTRVLSDIYGCDSTITIDLAVLNPTIVLGAIPPLNCFSDSVTIDASASVTDYATAYRWLALGGNEVATGPSFTTANSGVYVLELTESHRGVDCSVRDTFEILDERALPLVDPGQADTLTCSVVAVSLGGPGSSTGPAFSYQWSGPTGANFLDPTDQAVTRTATPGTYALLIVNEQTGCRDSLTVDIAQDTVSPPATIIGEGVLNCAVSSILLAADSTQANVDELEFSWTSVCLPQPVLSRQLNVDCPGLYRLNVRNLRTGCLSTATLEITQNTTPPLADIVAPQVLDCYAPTQWLDGSGSQPDPGIAYAWSYENGPVIGTDDSLEISVGGIYQLLVVDTSNFCRDSTAVTVSVDQQAPVADAGPDTTALTCYTPQLVLGGPNGSQGPEFSHSWTMVGLPDDTLGFDPTLDVMAPGGYFELSVLNTTNGCVSYDSSRVLLQLDTPFVRIQEPIRFSCFADVVELDASATFLDYDFQLDWSGGPCLPGFTDSTVIAVECPGTYALTVTNLDNGCVGDSSVMVLLEPNAMVAVLPDSAFINCNTGLATIDRSLSTPSVTTEWLRDGVEVNLVGQNPEVNVPGTYTLIIGNFDGSCRDTATIEVVANCPLLSIIIPPDSLTCANTEVLLDAGPSISFDPLLTSVEWLIPIPACAQPGANDRQIIVACPGDYGFVINDLMNGNSDTTYVTVVQDLIQPIVDAGPNDTITCLQNSVTLDAVLSQQDPRFSYAWTNSSDDTLSLGQIAMTNESGVYFLRVLNEETGCFAVDAVTIFRNVTTPDLDFSNTFIPCREDSFLLTVMTDPAAGNYDFSWSGPLIQAQADSATVVIGQAGTYTATVTNLDNGCPTAEDVLLEQLPCPPCLELPDTVLTCVSDTVWLQATYCEPCQGCSYQWFSGGNPIAGATTDVLPVTTAGTYRLRAENTFGLVSQVSATVTDLRVLPQNAAGPDRFLTCDSSSVLLGKEIIDTIFGFTYQWLDAVGTAIPGATDHYLTVNVTGTFILRSSNAVSQCSNVDTVLVAYDTLPPIVDAGPPVELTCDDPLNVLDGQGTATGSAIEYIWSGGPSATCLEGAGTLSPIVACGGTYELWVRDRRNGCVNRDTVIVTASDSLPEIIPLPDTSLTCAVNSIMLNPFVENPAYVSTWCRVDVNSDTIPGSCVSGANFEATSTGTYRYLVSNLATGCRNGFDLTIGEDYRPPAVLTGASDTLYCTLDSLALTGGGSTQTGSIPQFQWTSATGFAIGNADQDTAFAYQPDRYYLTVTDPENGCSAIDSIDFFQDITAPNAAAGMDTVLNCQRRQLRLVGSGQTFSGQIIYGWSTMDGNIVSGGSGTTPLVDQAGSYLFSVTDPVNSCTTQDIVTVTEDTVKPAAAFTADTRFLINCFLPTTILDATSSDAGNGHDLSYSWRTQGVGTDLSGQTDPQVTIDAAGSYQLVVTDAVNRCRDTLSVSVNSDFSRPAYQADVPGTLTCDTLSVNLSIQLQDPVADYRFEWSALAGGPVLGTDRTQVVTAPGIYQVFVQDTLNGCTRTTVLNVAEDTEAPSITLAPVADLNCDRPFVVLDAGNSSTGTNFSSDWSTVDGVIATLPNPYRVRAMEAGTYAFTLENNTNGCVATESITVNRIARFIDALSLETIDPACERDLTGSVMVVGLDGGTPPFRFRLDGGLLTDRMFYDDLPVGSYTLSVIDSSGCARSEDFVIEPSTPVQLSLGPDTTINQGDSVALRFVTNLGSWDTLIWESQGPLPRPGTLPAYVRPLSGSTYRLTIIDENGCSATDAIRIEVLNNLALYVPNTFSPNGDNVNDLFFPYAGPQIRRVLNFQIFDRWGNLVHQAADFNPGDPAFGWDGKLDGSPMNSHVFVWQLQLELADGAVIQESGDVLLQR